MEMKGLKEAALSFSLTLLTLVAFSQIRKHNERTAPNDAPTASSGPSTDIRLSKNWGFELINAPRAWTKYRNSRNVVVAVIDTGCDVHHPALRANLWRNPGEAGLDVNGDPKSSNGIDDDGNGFVDDFHGWNFASNNNDLTDEHGHGTHISGIIGARKLDGSGMDGVAPNVSLMILKYYDPQADGEDNLRDTISAIRYAVRMGADIINYSGGGVMKSAEEEAALRRAAEQGVLVVAAAGNEGMNSDFFHFYPADYELPNILSVAAVDQKSQLLRMSNFGIQTVDLAAPGKNIYSTLPNSQYGYMTGTSQATAFASGVAALLLADRRGLRSPARIIDHLLAHTRKTNWLKAKMRSGGVLDAQPLLANPVLKVSEVQEN